MQPPLLEVFIYIVIFFGNGTAEEILHLGTKLQSPPLTNKVLVLQSNEVLHPFGEPPDHDQVQVQVGSPVAVEEEEAEDVGDVGDEVDALGEDARAPKRVQGGTDQRKGICGEKRGDLNSDIMDAH